MIDTPIFAENTRQYYQIDPGNIILQIEEVFDDYQHRSWWEKGIYYNYEIILYQNPKTNKCAFIGSYIDIRGKILGCADCAATKLWYVKEFECDKDKTSDEYKDNIRQALKTYEIYIPHQIYVKFLEELGKEIGFTIWNEKEVIKL